MDDGHILLLVSRFFGNFPRETLKRHFSIVALRKNMAFIALFGLLTITFMLLAVGLFTAKVGYVNPSLNLIGFSNHLLGSRKLVVRSVPLPPWLRTISACLSSWLLRNCASQRFLSVTSNVSIKIFPPMLSNRDLFFFAASGQLNDL